MTLWKRMLILLAAAGAPAAARSADGPGCLKVFAGGKPPALVNPVRGTRTTPLCYQSYAVLASALTSGPVWSAEHLAAATLDNAGETGTTGGHPDEGHGEPRLGFDDQAQPEDYKTSKYERGYMTPPADMPDTAARLESLTLTNAVPEMRALSSGPWESIEAITRRLAADAGDAFVVTGPAYQSHDLDMIGPSGVLVPSSVWKAIYLPASGTAGAYLCTNTAKPSCQTISLDDLQEATGISPFPVASPEARKTAMALPAPGAGSYVPESDKPQGHATPAKPARKAAGAP